MEAVVRNSNKRPPEILASGILGIGADEILQKPVAVRVLTRSAPGISHPRPGSPAGMEPAGTESVCTVPAGTESAGCGSEANARSAL